MNAILIALFVSASAQGLPAQKAPAPSDAHALSGSAIDGPDSAVRKFAGKARALTAEADSIIDAASALERKAVHGRSAKKPAFATAPPARSIA